MTQFVVKDARLLRAASTTMEPKLKKNAISVTRATRFVYVRSVTKQVALLAVLPSAKNVCVCRGVSNVMKLRLHVLDAVEYIVHRAWQFTVVPMVITGMEWTLLGTFILLLFEM